MNRLKMISIVLLIGAAMWASWYFALKSNRYPMLRALAQLVHTPSSFYKSSAIDVHKSGNTYVATFQFTPSYAGMYQVNLLSPSAKYGNIVGLESSLNCQSVAGEVGLRANTGRFEYDLIFGMGLNIYSMDAGSQFRVGVQYRCEFVAVIPASDNDWTFEHLIVRKLSDN